MRSSQVHGARRGAGADVAARSRTRSTTTSRDGSVANVLAARSLREAAIGSEKCRACSERHSQCLRSAARTRTSRAARRDACPPHDVRRRAIVNTSRNSLISQLRSPLHRGPLPNTGQKLTRLFMPRGICQADVDARGTTSW